MRQRSHLHLWRKPSFTASGKRGGTRDNHTRPALAARLSSLPLIACLFLLGIGVFSLSGCQEIGDGFSSSSQGPVADYPVSLGQAGTIFTQAPETAASLSPALTEILFELGYQASLTGRSSYCDYPESVQALPDLGSSANPDLNAILTLKPQVLLSQSPIATRHITRLEEAGVRVLILPAPTSLSELKNCYQSLAALFGGASHAAEKADEIFAPLSEEMKQAAQMKEAEPGTPAVPYCGDFVYIMTSQLAAATGDTLAGDFLSRYGENLAGGGQDYSFSVEDLLEQDPDTLFCAAPLTKESFTGVLGELSSIKNGRVLVLDNLCFERPTARRLTEEAKKIRSALEQIPAAVLENEPSSSGK